MQSGVKLSRGVKRERRAFITPVRVCARARPHARTRWLREESALILPSNLLVTKALEAGQQGTYAATMFVPGFGVSRGFTCSILEHVGWRADVR